MSKRVDEAGIRDGQLVGRYWGFREGLLVSAGGEYSALITVPHDSIGTALVFLFFILFFSRRRGRLAAGAGAAAARRIRRPVGY